MIKTKKNISILLILIFIVATICISSFIYTLFGQKNNVPSKAKLVYVGGEYIGCIFKA